MSEEIKKEAREVTTESGFKCVVDEAALDDFELFEALADMDNREDGMAMLSAFKKVLSSLLGEEQKDRLYDHIKAGNGGRVRASALKTELLQIFTGLSKAKKN